MKAARLHRYDDSMPRRSTSIDEPRIEGPFDVIVKVGAAGLCRTDIHVMKASGPRSRGRQPSALHPGPRELGLGRGGRLGRHQRRARGYRDLPPPHDLRRCAAPAAPGDDMHCANGAFPGISRRRLRRTPQDQRPRAS